MLTGIPKAPLHLRLPWVGGVSKVNKLEPQPKLCTIWEEKCSHFEGKPLSQPHLFTHFQTHPQPPCLEEPEWRHTGRGF